MKELTRITTDPEVMGGKPYGLLGGDDCDGDPFELTIADPDHSEGEQRYLSIGSSAAGRLLVVAYTERGGRIRIISAREAGSQERKHYESTSASER